MLFPSPTEKPQISGYALLALLGEGGSGTVYRAREESSGRTVAIKVMKAESTASAESVARFEQEARMLNQLRHPNLVEVYGMGLSNEGRPFLVMEYLEGLTLSQLVDARRRMSPDEALRYLEPVCAALHAAHLAGFIHRDVKSSNVIVVRAKEDNTNTGSSPTVKLLDFGVARYLNPALRIQGLTGRARRLGTPFAMAPEQVRGEEVDVRTDVYGLGVLLFDLLTGESRFDQTTSSVAAVELATLNAKPEPPSARVPVQPAVDAVVLRALEKAPANRFPTAQAFLEALREAVYPSNSMADDLVSEALAVFVDVRSAQGEAPSETDFETVEDVVAIAEEELADAGFAIPVTRATSALGIRLLSAAGLTGKRVDSLLRQVARVGQAARDALGPDGAHLRVCLSVHIDGVRTRRHPASGRPEMIGGPLLETQAWAPRLAMASLVATARAATMLGLEGTRASGFVVVPERGD